MLDRLPPEILLLIVESLDTIHPDSVLDLICTNKHCYSVAAAILYRTLKFSVNDSEQLAEDVQHYSQLLKRVNGWSSVRRLIISNNNTCEATRQAQFERRRSIQLQHQQKELKEQQLHHRPPQPPQWHRPAMSSVELRGHDQEILEQLTRQRKQDWKANRERARLDKSQQSDHLWESIAGFIRQIDNLKSLFFDSYFQYPPLLLDTIHKCQPQCRLYITNFNLWSLNSRGTEDEYEFALLSSPSLYGIGMEFEEMRGEDSFGNAVYTTRALRSLVGGLTPNLKELCMIHHATEAHFPTNEPQQPWLGFSQQANDNVGKRRGSLDYLMVLTADVIDRDDIEMWNEDTDLSALKTLRLVAPLQQDAVEYLGEECNFSSLTELDINFMEINQRWQSEEYFSAAKEFLLKLPSLSTLLISGWHSDMANDLVFQHQGSRLQKLSLQGEPISRHGLRQFSEHCPYLEDLSIVISRSRGDAQETAKYRAIGLLHRLKRLHLKLDASEIDLLEQDRDENGNKVVVTRNDPSFNDFDQQYCKEINYANRRYARNGHVRDVLINCAMDRDLAYDIFQTICLGKSSLSEPPPVLPLQSLEVEVVGPGPFYWGLMRIPKHFHDLLSRVGQKVSVKSILGKNGVSKLSVNHVPVDSECSKLEPWLEEVYHRVWPARGESWTEDWHSFPLAVSAADEIDWKAR